MSESDRAGRRAPPSEPRAFELRVHDAMREIDPAAWDALVGPDGPPFLSWAFLDALERTGCVGEGTSWAPHHVTLWQADRLAAAAPGYLKGNSEGEFVFDHAWARAAAHFGVAYYPKLLFAVPFTPATGPRLLAGPDERAALLPVFAEAVRKLVRAHGLSSGHVLFPPAEDAAVLARAGLAHRHGIQFQWENRGYSTFEDFLGSFNAKRRHQIRRERRELERAGVTLETLAGASLTPEVVDAMFGFYLSTVQKFYWGRQYLNRAFFEEICAKVPGGVEIVLAREGGRPIAGAFNLRSPTTLFGRYWGASVERPFLHFNVCYYHSIDRAIAGRLRRFEPGAGGEHKVARGFEPTVTHSLHHVDDPDMNRAIRDFVGRERRAIEASLAEGGDRA
jgi:predicted N-acyltransferase